MNDLENIQKAILLLGKKIDEQNSRLQRLENASGIKTEIKPESPANGFSSVRNEIKQFQNIETNEQKNESESEYKNVELAEMPKENLEENIGVKWFSAIGITALFLGISFFIKYAFDNNWITPTGRVAIGVIAGIILLALGEKLIRKYSLYAQILSGGGIAVLYLSIYAAMNFYSLIGQTPTFILMMLITAIGIFLSLRYDAISLMVVSTLGGFLTPMLVSTGKNNELALFSYILILNLAILFVAIFKKWRVINLIGFVGTVLIFSGWAEEFYSKDQLAMTMVFLTLFFIIYSISSLVYNLAKKENSTGIEQILTLVCAVAYFTASYSLLNGDYHSFVGFFAVILAFYYLLWAYSVRALTPKDDNLYNFLAFLGLGFITLAIPIQFEQKVITISWGIESAILFYLGIKTKKEITKIFALAIFSLAMYRLLVLDSGFDFENTVVLNKTLFAFLFFIVLSYLSSGMFNWASRDEENNKGTLRADQMAIFFIIIANLLTIFAISREITFAYDKQINQVRKTEVINPQSRSSRYGDYDVTNSYVKTNNAKIEKIQNKKSVSLSIFWMIYGIILMIIGMMMRNKILRIGGLAILILAILKLFFYDLWNLGTLYRIISSISLGIVLLLISFAYQKYKDRLKEII